MGQFKVDFLVGKNGKFSRCFVLICPKKDILRAEREYAIYKTLEDDNMFSTPQAII